MKKSRRQFLRDSALIAGGLSAAGKASFASAPIQQDTQGENDIIICVFQRGAADGLHSIVPYAEQEYFNLRPQTGISNSIDLDGFFGLNPELSALKSIWDAGDLGIIHAIGSPSDSRSHFDAQDSMEFADFDKNNVRNGWLGKYLALTQTASDSVFRAVSLNDAVQKSLKSEIEALTVASLTDFNILTHENLSAASRQTMATMYENDGEFASSSRVLFSAIDTVQNINPDDYPVDNGASYQNNPFAKKLKTLSVLIKADLGVNVACVDIGGWDHHNNIVASFKKPANALANGLQAFYQDMGQRMNNITILCMTEFGRRAGENASLGTDHGHASVMYGIGKNINGGIHGNWPGLTENNLYRGDLAVTTDFREVFAELLRKRLHFQQDLSLIIPDFNYQGGIGFFK